METVKVHGIDELRRRLEALPREIAGKNGGPLLAALRKMGRKVQGDAKRIVRKKSGTLADNIIVVRSKDPRRVNATEAVRVTIRYKAKKYKDTKANRKAGRVGGKYKELGPLFYARFLEFGTSRQPAYPFMIPAFDMNKNDMPNIFKTELGAAIDRAVKKLSKR